MLAVAQMAVASHAQWDLTVVTSASTNKVKINATDGTTFYGSHDRYNAEGDIDPHAASWTGGVESNMDPTSGDFAYSSVDAFDGAHPRGNLGSYSGGYWTSNQPSGFVSLTPSGATSSRLLGARDGKQYGYYTGHGAIWSGSPQSAMPFSTGSLYDGVAGEQVGTLNGHALVWHDNPNAPIDMHPAGYNYSVARGTDGIHQFGSVVIVRQVTDDVYAAMWSGSAASFVNINPAGSRRSSISRVLDGCAVGYSLFDNPHGGYWTPDGGFHDIQSFLPSPYTYSYLTGVQRIGNTLYLMGYAGYGFDSYDGIVLTRAVPEPASVLSVLVGVALLGRKRRRTVAARN